MQPIFDTLKPPTEESRQSARRGFVHAGPVGAGHFTKMVHNGIEYGMMQAYGEGYELLSAVDLVEDAAGVIASWQQGTVIRSWLLDLLVRALQEDPALEQIRGYAQDSGEGRWTIEAAIENAVPMPVITAALFARFASRQDDSPAMKVVAALRNQFGGHAVHTSVDTRPAATPGARASRALSRAERVRAAPAARLLPSWERVDLRAGPGVHGVGRPQRRGQDQPGGGGRLPGDPEQPPGVLRRPAGPARHRAGGRPGGAAPG